jgi:ATP-binding cassette subfamily B protein
VLRSIKGGRAVASEEELRAVGTSRRIFRVGFAGLASGGRQEWRTFVPSVLAAVVQGGAIVAAASGLGWVTSNIITPAFTSGRVGVGAALTAAAVVVGFSLLRVCGLVSRRVASGVTQFRLQARYRRALTGRYLRLSLAWHRRNPPGQMLSTVGSDVEAMWSPMMPFPFAIGVLFMLLAGVAATVAADPVLAVVASVLVPPTSGPAGSPPRSTRSSSCSPPPACSSCCWSARAASPGAPSTPGCSSRSPIS